MLKAASSVAALVILCGLVGPLTGLIEKIGKSIDEDKNVGSQPIVPVVPIEQPKPEGPAVVTIQTSVKGARVLIDGEFQGTTPLDKPAELPAGEHQFELTFGKSKRVGKLQLQPVQQLSWPALNQDFSTDQITTAGQRAVCLLRTPDGRRLVTHTVASRGGRVISWPQFLFPNRWCVRSTNCDPKA